MRHRGDWECDTEETGNATQRRLGMRHRGDWECDTEETGNATEDTGVPGAVLDFLDAVVPGDELLQLSQVQRQVLFLA